MIPGRGFRPTGLAGGVGGGPWAFRVRLAIKIAPRGFLALLWTTSSPIGVKDPKTLLGRSTLSVTALTCYDSNLFTCDAARRKFDCVVFWALDRFSREGMAQTIVHLQRLTSYSVAFHSYTEPHLATDNELVRNILLALLSSLAKVEAQKISDRTKAGMARAKAKGIKIGRPRLAIEIRQQIVRRAAKGSRVTLRPASNGRVNSEPKRRTTALD